MQSFQGLCRSHLGSPDFCEYIVSWYRVKFPVEQSLGHQLGSASRTSRVSFDRRNTRQKLTTKNILSFPLVLCALTLLPPMTCHRKCVVWLLTGDICIGLHFMEKMHAWLQELLIVATLNRCCSISCSASCHLRAQTFDRVRIHQH